MTVIEERAELTWRHDEPFESERLTIELGQTEHYFVDMRVMLFGNTRLVMTPKAAPEGWAAGWCFRTAIEAALAAAMWQDPEAGAPVGWFKSWGAWPL